MKKPRNYKSGIINLLLILMLSGFANAQNFTVTGKVTEASSGNNLLGVTVIVTGTTLGTISEI